MYLRQSLVHSTVEYLLFTTITWVLWLLLTLNLYLFIGLNTLTQKNIKTLILQKNEFVYYLDLYSSSNFRFSSYNLVQSLTKLHVWESWLLVDSYSYPFAYTFIIVIALSFINCLSYHRDELRSFVLFLKLITISGFIVFTSNSMILFFLAYEALLVPSFMVLYRFAKSRRCIEAAYAMFF